MPIRIAHPKHSIVDQKYREHLITSGKKRKFRESDISLSSMFCTCIKNGIKRQIRRRRVPSVNVQDLERRLLEEWQRITPNVIRRLTSSVRRRVLACIDAHGAHTRY